MIQANLFITEIVDLYNFKVLQAMTLKLSPKLINDGAIFFFKIE